MPEIQMSRNEAMEARLAHFNRIADRIIAAVDGVEQERAHIQELRQAYRDLAKGERISDCSTWSQFCVVKLHMSPRNAQFLLYGRPSRAKPIADRTIEQGPWEAFSDAVSHVIDLGVACYQHGGSEHGDALEVVLALGNLPQRFFETISAKTPVQPAQSETSLPDRELSTAEMLRYAAGPNPRRTEGK